MKVNLLQVKFMMSKAIIYFIFFTLLTLTPRISLAADPTISNITSTPGSGVVNISGSAVSTAGLITNVGYQVDTNTGSFTDATLSNQIQAGDIDESFLHGNGLGASIGAAGNPVSALAVQSDGKIIIGGTFPSYNGVSAGNIARVNPDSTLDTGFGSAVGTNGNVAAIVIQPDGKIIIGGTFTSYNGTTVGNVIRLNADGSLDNTFNSGGVGAGGAVYTIAIQSDGKIIIGGAFTTYNTVSRNRIARLNADGSLDTGFTVGTGANGNVNALAIQSSDGYIIIGGAFTTYNGTGRVRLARLKIDGTLDTAFTVGTGADGTISALAIQPSDGKIVIGGSFSNYASTGRVRIARVNTDGSLDTSFVVGTGATGTSNAVSAIYIQVDGKVLIGGTFSAYNGTTANNISRLNNDGTIDTLFNNGTAGANNLVAAITKQPSDNKLIIGGKFINYNGTGIMKLARLSADGVLDTTFNVIGTGFNSILSSTVSRQSDNKLIFIGQFSAYNGVTANRIVRLNTDGSLDVDFNNGGSAVTGGSEVVFSSAIQADGKILIGGTSFASFNGIAINNIARLNSNGSLDNSFNPGTGANLGVRVIAVQSDGKILIAGSFTSYNGTTINRIARLNSDGSLDTSFNVGTGVGSSYVNAMALQPDGKIIISGTFTSYNGTTIGNIARLNSDGSLDTSFNLGGAGANGNVNKFVLLANGKIIIAGTFTTYNGVGPGYIARLNSDGSLDTSFNLGGAGANGSVQSLGLQADGKIVAGGSFTSYNGTAVNRITRLNSDGTLDASFNIGTGTNNNVLITDVQLDGKVIIGGLFTSYRDTVLNYALRLYGLNSSSFSASIPTTGLTPGTHTLYLKSADNAANTNTISTTFTVPDTTNPVITLKGLSNFSINQGESYTDLGATASDNVDGDITSNITVHNSLNSSVLGTYSITYDVSDAAGNHAAQVTRTITVQAPATASTSGTIPVASLSSPVCTSVTYGDYSTSCFAGYQYRPIISRTPENCVTTVTQEDNAKQLCSAEVNVSNVSYITPTSTTTSFFSQEKSLVTIIDKTLTNRLSGRILLQVEGKGQGWYVNPLNGLKYFLGAPSDAFSLMRELSLGISNKSFNSLNANTAPKRLSGRILLKVEDSGKAYYVNPLNLKLYYLGRPQDAYDLMRTLGLGITNSDLRKIGVGEIE